MSASDDDTPSTAPAARGLRRNLATYGDPGFSLFLRKAFIKAAGFSDDALDRPIIGITNTFSDFNPCHGNVPRLIEAVKRGVMLAGGLPMEFPTISIHESFANPTSMFLRNLMAIDTEEMIRAQPCDSVVLIGGCDKTVPAQLMGAVSADVPAIQLITGPMLVGHHKGEVLGACTDCRRLWGQHRAGQIDEAEIEVLSGRLAPTQGTCMVMGTASTMGCLVEALGIALPGSGTIPATHADRIRAAEASGREAVRLAKGGPKPSELLTKTAFRNALTVLQAIGGSTNGLVHLAAIARRAGLSIDLEEFDAIGRKVPVLIDLKPSGDHYMEHFHWAGGVPKLMKELGDHLDRSAPTIDGRTIGEIADAAEDIPNQTIIRSAASPVKPTGGMAVLRGNLAPGGAVIKHSAASPALLKHTGRAVVFASVEDMVRRMDDPALDVKADDVLVLTNAGPKGAPGMPEAGYIPIPKKLAQAGVKDMVRISDARMSGTAFGTIVLHITPESAVGGPLGLVRDGDMIRLDVEAREIALLVDAAELERRKSEWRPPAHLAEASRGYRHLYLTTVLQADEGCDFDFC
ncbi:MAG: IlvD/Edd family dehydratase [Bosea sp. (in: a-proteobacteria)]|uniref:IlvD/Edd family dehydratase n=1 Tax=Bosea sp. (in: a-proteobacteria) TaxID=1871050 RepID=UPI0027330186|nr:IlvD/Edd family dehydratase [Bosea sp. (in: a-proteobacteria)]MDP3257370.1 IlvD/Edd family dehydratase [Bosea sp. (in: a-proteobacteria)]MDP3320377.1 IlvD/Edd family dehydratase [Bosea sp. (in: a-proteobacteria)]